MTLLSKSLKKGPWQLEYEQNWREFSLECIRQHFGDLYWQQKVEESDLKVLKETLKVINPMGDHEHLYNVPLRERNALLLSDQVLIVVQAKANDKEVIPPTQVLRQQQSQEEQEEPSHQSDMMMMSASDTSSTSAMSMSDVSYVYKTPEPKTSRLSNFPEFCSQDIASADQTRLESVSQKLYDRMADFSPIDPIAFAGSSQNHHHQQQQQQQQPQSQEKDESMVLFEMRSPSPSIPKPRTNNGLLMTPTPILLPKRRRPFAKVSRMESPMVADEEAIEQMDTSMRSLNVTGEPYTPDFRHPAQEEEEEEEKQKQEQEEAVIEDKGEDPIVILQPEKRLSFRNCSDDELQEQEQPVEEQEQDKENERPMNHSKVVSTKNRLTLKGKKTKHHQQYKQQQKQKRGLLYTRLPLQLEDTNEAKRRRRRKKKSNESRPSSSPSSSSHASCTSPTVITKPPVTTIAINSICQDLRIKLQPYQQEAVTWMLEREENPTARTKGAKATLLQQVRGGILADEMGLGKTICCIALICKSLAKFKASQGQQTNIGSSSESEPTESERMENNIRKLQAPTLIITPLSILSQWEQEIRTKSTLSVAVYHGNSRKRFQTKLDFMGYDIVLSTYDTLRLKECKVDTKKKNVPEKEEEEEEIARNHRRFSKDNTWRNAVRTIEEEKKSISMSRLHLVYWQRVILDESHLIANALCARAKAAFSLRARRRWCVTGTPIQNSPRDLDSLLKFIGLSDVQEYEEDRLEEILPWIMLRRLKKTVDQISQVPILSLPEKKEEIRMLTFRSEMEQAFYLLLHHTTKRQVLQWLTSNSTSRSNSVVTSTGKNNTMHVFELVLRLRQTCDSFQLLTKNPFSEMEKNFELLGEIGTLSRKDVALLQRVQQREQQSSSNPIETSTKLQALIEELIQIKASGEKCLVISQWTSFLDLIVDAIEQVGEDLAALRIGRLDGKMAPKDRERVIQQFQDLNQLDVLLMSLRAGAVGLNLTAASHVLIMEPSWNPSIENQAIDRIHRFGQDKQVRIIRFLMKETIEERVYQLQKQKKQVANILLGDEDNLETTTGTPSTLGRHEWEALFSETIEVVEEQEETV